MQGTGKLLSEKNVHVAFEVSLLFKGAFAVLEIATGIFAYFVTQQFLLDMAHLVTRAELNFGKSGIFTSTGGRLTSLRPRI